jgi:hypothetical protein
MKNRTIKFKTENTKYRPVVTIYALFDRIPTNAKKVVLKEFNNWLVLESKKLKI